MADGTIDIDTEIDGDAAEAGLQSLQDSLEKTGKKMQDMGKGMTAGVTAPIMAVGGMALKTAADFESANGKMQAQLGLTAAETEKYGDMAADMWKNAFGENIGDVTGAIATVKQNLGDLNDQDLQQVTEAAFTLQDVFEVDMAESTATAGVMMKNFGIDSAKAMDLMTVGMQKGGNFSGELLGTMGEYAPIFATMGHSAEDMMNILISGAEAGAFNLDKVGDSMKEFNIRAKDGSDATAEGFEAIGLNAADMGTAIAEGGEKGEQAFQATIAGLAAMDSETERNAAGVALFGATWEDLESDVVLAMANSTNHVEGFHGATERAGAAAYDTFGSRLTTLWRTVQESLLPLGELMLEMAEKFIPPLIEIVTQLADWFSGLSGEVQTGIIVFGGILAAIGPVLVVLGTIVGAIAPLMPALAKAWTLLKKLKTVFTVLRTAMLILTGPVGIVIAIVTTLGILIYKNWDLIKEKTAAVFGWIGEFLPVLWAGIKAGAGIFLEFLKNMIVAGFEFIKTVIVGIWTGIKIFFTAIWEGIVWLVTTYINIVKTIITTVFNVIKTVVVAIWNGIKAFFMAIWEGIVWAVTTYINIVKTIITTVFNAIKTVITTVWNAIKAAISTVWTAIKNIVSTAINNLKNNITNVFNAVKTTISTIFNAIKTTITNVWNAIKSFVSNTLNAMKSTVTNIFNQMKTAISNAMNKVKSTISDAFNKVLSTVKGLGTKFYNAGKGLIEQIINGIKAMIGKVTGLMGDLAGKMRDFLPFSPAKTGPLSDLDQLDFGGPVGDSIKKAIPLVKSKMAHLLQMPKLQGPDSGRAAIAAAGGGAASVTHGNTVNHFNVYTKDGQQVNIRQLSQELYKLQKRDQKGAGTK